MNNYPSDIIRIMELEVYAYHGVLKEERDKGQYFYVSADLYTNLRKAGMTDDLQYTTSYAEVCDFITQFMSQNTYNLIETAAEQLAQAILLQFDQIYNVVLEVRKPDAPVSQNVGSLSVNVERGWHQVYISFGSNVGDREKYIDDAIETLGSIPYIGIETVSKKFETKPYGKTDQPDFLNGAMEIKTMLYPEELLEILKQLEEHAGRERKEHWGPRTLDLDILFYDNLFISSSDLTIPHPDLKNREFVLKPMMEIAPYKVHPFYNITIKDMYEALLKKNNK